MAVKIYVVDVNERPTLPSSGSVGITIPENWPLAVPVNQAIAGQDPDWVNLPEDVERQDLGYKLLSQTPSNVFTIETLARQGLLKLAKGLNFEDRESHTVKVSVKDNGNPALSADLVYTVKVTDVNEPPSFIDVSGFDDEKEIELRIDENGSGDETLSASPLFAFDPDANDKLSYTLIEGDSNCFELQSVNTGKGRFNVKVRNNCVFDFEGNVNQFKLRVQVEDSGKPYAIGTECEFIDAQSAAIVCGPGAECKESASPDTADRCYETCYATDKREVGAIGRKDEFYCDYNDDETPITVVHETDVATINVKVVDKNDPPRIAMLDEDGRENRTRACSLDVTVVGGGAKAQQEQTIIRSLLALDDDTISGTFGAAPFKFSKGSWGGMSATSGANRDTLFEVDASTGEVTYNPVDSGSTVSAYLQNGNTFSGTIIVSDNNAVKRPGEPAGSSTCAINVEVLEFNTVPTLEDQSGSITEAAQEGDVVIDSFGDLTAIDADTDPSIPAAQRDSLTFSMSPTPFFNLDPKTGKITVGTGIDYESLKDSGTNAYTLIVKVRDTHGAEDVADVTITVSDVNEQPGFDSSVGIVTVNETAVPGDSLFDLSAVSFDPDRYAAEHGDADWFQRSYALENCDGKCDGCPFVLDAARIVLASGCALDYEEGVREFAFKANVSDGEGLNDVADITVQVQDVNEPPKFRDSAVTVPEDAIADTSILALSELVTDPDAKDQGKLVITVETPSDPGLFEVDDSTQTLVLKRTLDYETKQTYQISVTAEDSDGEKGSATITVNVGNVNDVKIDTIDLSSGTIACDGSTSVTITGSNFGLKSGGANNVAR